MLRKRAPTERSSPSTTTSHGTPSAACRTPTSRSSSIDSGYALEYKRGLAGLVDPLPRPPAGGRESGTVRPELSEISAMRRTYIHLSDLHFGQERGSDLHLHRDVLERLIDDVKRLAAREPENPTAGVIVTGDIAFSGKEAQYLKAGEWLERLCKAIGCNANDVLVVPGNHDVDYDEITPGCDAFLHNVRKDGEEELERYLRSPRDREVLYGRFRSYRAFAEAYACPIDTESGYTVDRKVQIRPGRFLRILGLNSALVCSAASHERGQLLLGARQRTFPQDAGHELVVLCHHPLDWLRDSADTTRFARARARVVITGHTHSPSSLVERDPVKGDIIFISAGATIPPSNETGYAFTYNILSFDWADRSEALTVTIEARTWSAETTCFAADRTGLGRTSHTLKCPNFETVGQGRLGRESIVGIPGQRATAVNKSKETHSNDPRRRTMAREDELLRLRFFRDLTVKQRANVLVELGVLPHGDWVLDEMTHTLARHLLDSVLSTGRVANCVGQWTPRRNRGL